MANPRTLARLQERIRERAAYCLQFEVNDPRASFITITRVELSADYGNAKIFYSVLGDEADKNKVAHMLKHASGFVQRQVARVLETRRVPILRWIFDGSSEQAADMDRLIREARERDRSINPALGPENELVRPREGQAPAPAAPTGDEREAELDEDDTDFEELGGAGWADEGEEAEEETPPPGPRG